MRIDRSAPQIQNWFFHLAHAVDRFIILKDKILPDMIQHTDLPPGALIWNILGAVCRSNGPHFSHLVSQTIRREFLHFMRPFFRFRKQQFSWRVRVRQVRLIKGYTSRFPDDLCRDDCCAQTYQVLLLCAQ